MHHDSREYRAAGDGGGRFQRAAGTDPARIVAEARKLLRGAGRQGRRPHLWDGKAAQRIVAVLAEELVRT